METFNFIKFGISDDFSHSFGNSAITNVISLKYNELLVSTTTDIYIIDYKNKTVKTKYQLKFSACTIIPDTKFIIGVSIKKCDLLIYFTNGNSLTLLKKFPTNQAGVYNVIFSKKSQSIVTFGTEIKVFNFQCKTVKSKINVSITNRSSFPNKLDPSNLVFPQFDPKYEIILLPTEKGIMSFNLDGKKVKQLTTNPATSQTIFSSSSDLKSVLTFDSKSGMILYKNKNKAIQKFETIRSDILAIISIDSENSICLNSCHILFYVNIKTGKTFYYMNLNKNPTRLFLINLYNEPVLCACFGSNLRALNLVIPWQVWRLNIEKITKISRCNKYMTAARILVETENSFVKFFSPRDKEQITTQLPDDCNHPIFYFYDRGTFENYIFDPKNQIYNIDVIKITNQLNFVRDTLFFILQNGSIIKIETNVKDGQKEVKLNCQAILMTICRIRLQKNTNNFKWCFAVALENGDLHIIDYFTFDEICHFSIPNDGLIQMYYHFESNFIVLVFPKKTVLFDLETGKIVDSIELDGNKTTSLFADFLMYGYESGHIQRVKIENNQLVMCNDVKQKTKSSSLKINKIESRMLKPHSCPITAFSFSPKIWISSGLDGNIVAYNYNFDIICKISLPLPLRSCLIMNGRRDIIVATATEIMEIKNEYLFYDVNTTKTRKTSQTQLNKNNKLSVDNMNVVGEEEEEEEEDSVDPEIKEIDNFDRMKDEFFCVNKNKNIVEEADEASSEAEKNEVNKEEMKQIRKFRRSKMTNNNNKASSITTQSIKSLPKNSEDEIINKNEDLKKKSDENQSEKTDQIKKDEKEKQNPDSNKDLSENEKNDSNKDKNLKEEEIENDPNSDKKIKPDTNADENTDSSSLLNKKDEDQNNSNNDSQLNDQLKLNSNSLCNENDTNNDLQSSRETDQITDKDINENDSTQDDQFSENENSNENDTESSDNSLIIESTEKENSNSINENADEANQSSESDNQDLSSELNENDQSETNEINENDEQDNVNTDLEKSGENQNIENTELNDSDAINKDNTSEDNENIKNDFNDDSNETVAQQEEEERAETDKNETETNNNEDSTPDDQQSSTNESEIDLHSSIETENDKQQEEEEQNQEDETNETSPDDSEEDSVQQQNVHDLSVTLDDNNCSINDSNFNENKEDTKSDSNMDPNSIRSPTPPPIRPTLTSGSSSSRFDDSDSTRFNHQRRSRTPSPRRSRRKDLCGGFRIPPNIVIDREAVLALYGRGRVEFRPFVEQIQREFLINNYDEEEGRTRHITLSYVNNLTSSIKKKQKQQDSHRNKFKKSSRQSTSLSSQINGNKTDQNNNDESNSSDSIINGSSTNSLQQKNKGLTFSHSRFLRPPLINLNKSFSPTAYVYNYDNNTETFFNKLEINNGVKTPRRLHACSVRQPLLMIQPKSACIVKPNVPAKRNQSFRNQRKSPSYKTESSRKRLNMLNSENNEISDNSQNNTNSP